MNKWKQLLHEQYIIKWKQLHSSHKFICITCSISFRWVVWSVPEKCNKLFTVSDSASETLPSSQREGISSCRCSNSNVIICFQAKNSITAKHVSNMLCGLHLNVFWKVCSGKFFQKPAIAYWNSTNTLSKNIYSCRMQFRASFQISWNNVSNIFPLPKLFWRYFNFSQNACVHVIRQIMILYSFFLWRVNFNFFITNFSRKTFRHVIPGI